MRAALTTAITCLALGGVCVGHDADAAIKRHTDIPPQLLAPALQTLVKERDIQLVYRAETIGDRRTAGASGELTAAEALGQLLNGTGLTYTYLDDKTITIVSATGMSDSRSPGQTRAASGQIGSEEDSQQQKARSSSFWDQFRLAQADLGGTASESSVSEESAEKTPQRGSAGLEEVVVTAQKRSERLQDVPIAVSAFTQQSIDRLEISDVNSLARVVPSMSFTNQFGVESRINLRGITGGDGLAPAVGTYVDETPIDTRGGTFTGTTLIDLFDIDRIEVLRGPQGTLFGASSMGGTIRMITAQPDPSRVHVRAEVEDSTTADGGPAWAVKGAYNQPLTDNLAVRVVAIYSYAGGFVDRTLPGSFAALTGNEEVTKPAENTLRTSSFRIAARWAPGDWTVTPSFIYQRTNALGYPIVYGPDYEKLRYPHIFTDPGLYTTSIGSIRVERDLGFASLVSASSYLDKVVDITADFAEYAQSYGQLFGFGTITPPPSAYLRIPVSFQGWTEELRLTSSSQGLIRWIAGAYFNRTSESNTLSLDIPSFSPPFPTPVLVSQSTPIRDRQFAAFGELTYAPIRQIEITAGLRAYSFHQSYAVAQSGPLAGPSAPESTSKHFGANPKLTLAYKPNEDLNFYTTAAKGFRAGGANAPLVGPDCRLTSGYKASYDPDTVWNYEAGAKTTFLHRRITLNSDVYWINWNGVQSAVSSPCTTFIANIGTARSRGAEIEAAVEVNEYLSLEAGYAYTDARLRMVNPDLLTANVGIPGQRIPDTPVSQYSVSGTFEAPLPANIWSVFVQSNWQHIGSSTSAYTVTSAPTSRSGYNNIDVTAGVRHRGLELSLYGTNLANGLEVQSVVQRPLSNNDYFVSRPRALGIRVRYAY